jgi:hypothetical protein
MPEPANPQDGDKVTRLGRSVAERAECRETGTQERRGSDSGEFRWDGHKPSRLGNQHLRIAAIVLDARVFLIAAVHEVTTPALLTAPAASTQKPYADALPHSPPLDPCA